MVMLQIRDWRAVTGLRAGAALRPVRGARIVTGDVHVAGVARGGGAAACGTW